jgi:hypothetical protein
MAHRQWRRLQSRCACRRPRPSVQVARTANPLDQIADIDLQRSPGRWEGAVRLGRDRQRPLSVRRQRLRRVTPSPAWTRRGAGQRCDQSLRPSRNRQRAAMRHVPGTVHRSGEISSRRRRSATVTPLVRCRSGRARARRCRARASREAHADDAAFAGWVVSGSMAGSVGFSRRAYGSASVRRPAKASSRMLKVRRRASLAV